MEELNQNNIPSLNTYHFFWMKKIRINQSPQINKLYSGGRNSKQLDLNSKVTPGMPGK